MYCTRPSDLLGSILAQLADDIDRIRLSIDMRFGQENQIRIAFDRGEQRVIQGFNLRHVPGSTHSRVVMLCQGSGQLLETVSYRRGLFADRAYQRLTFRSQLVPKKRPAKRTQKITI